MRKFTRSEKTEVLSPEAHKKIEDELHKLGKTSAQGLSKEEREKLADGLDK